MNPLQPILASSSDPTKVSTTVSGFIIGYSSLIVAVAGAVFHINLSAQNIIEFGTDLGYIAAAIVILVGLSHKLINKYGRIQPPQASLVNVTPTVVPHMISAQDPATSAE